jgi:SAM-dependent methyltransferase
MVADHLSPDARDDLSRMRSSSFLTAGRLLASRPALVPHMANVAVHGATDAVRNDPTLGWLAGVEHLRRVAPGSVMGADWGGLETFIEVFESVVQPTSTALEIGCGGGRVTRRLRPLVDRLDATDVSDAIVREAQRIEPGARYFVVEGLGDNLATDTYDIVASHDVFMHFEYDQCARYLANIARALHQGGSFVLSVYTLDSEDERNEYRAVAGAGDPLTARRVRRFPSTAYEALFDLFDLAPIDKRRTPPEEYPEPKVSTHLNYVLRYSPRTG